MTKKLWQIGDAKNDDFVESFIVGDDYFLDNELMPYDIKASKAHAKMLKKLRVLTDEENKKLQYALDEILKLHELGSFKIKQEHEDCHTAIEEYLTIKCGDTGKKIHTGRSRNDQVLVALRLFMKDQLKNLKKDLNSLITTFKKSSDKYKDIQMPGYTHYQKAMPTTCNVWLESFADSLLDTLPFLDALEKLLDQNPLGSASGFGIRNFKLDKEFTSKELDFKKVQKNPIYCGFSRGHFENIFLQTCSQITNCLSRFAADLLLFTTQEFDFVKLPEIFITGSSIMPQKRNPDSVEILQGKISAFLAKQNEIQNIILKLTSGYHREFQLIKKPFFEGLSLIFEVIQISKMLAEGVEFKKEKLQKAMTDDLFVTEKIYELVKKGIPFREAYKKVKREFFSE